MRCYPVGLTWETKGYNCTIKSTEIRKDYEHSWLSHNVEWKPKYDYSINITRTMQMSTKKLEKEFRRIGISPQPEDQAHFEEDLFSV